MGPLHDKQIRCASTPRNGEQPKKRVSQPSHSEPLKAELQQYVEAQREFFTANERYGARHELTDEDATPPADVEDLRIGHSRVAFNDSIPQMICGVFVGTAEPPLSVEMEDGIPVCQRETSVLVCEEGHAYPATVEYNFCPMHGHALAEVELDY